MTNKKTDSCKKVLLNARTAQIKAVLDGLYEKYNHRRLIWPDPLQFVYNYRNRADMEIAAFLSAALAYGRVAQIEKSLAELFSFMGNSPSGFVLKFSAAGRKKLKNFRHRFTGGDDISDLLELLQIVLKKFGSIETFFTLGYNSGDENIIPALSKFCQAMLQIRITNYDGKISRGLKYLLVSPDDKSACKRLNLFLRWMVRSDDVDMGLWKSIDKSKLIVPIDVHMARLCGIIGFSSGKNVSLKTALEITAGFKKIIPTDPAKYDFALSRVGIIENCSGKLRPQCNGCDLYSYCDRGVN